MAKLYFKYGSMGSSKTAQALITKYNYEENGMHVWLIKPAADERDGAIILRSRVGLEAPAEVVPPHSDIYELYRSREKTDVIIVDECQFLTPAQIDQLRDIVDVENIPVLCFGLRTDFQCKLFDGQPQAVRGGRTPSRRSRPSATAGPRPRSMPGWTARAASSRRAPSFCSEATTAILPCATSAGSATSASTAK